MATDCRIQSTTIQTNIEAKSTNVNINLIEPSTILSNNAGPIEKDCKYKRKYKAVSKENCRFRRQLKLQSRQFKSKLE